MGYGQYLVTPEIYQLVKRVKDIFFKFLNGDQDGIIHIINTDCL